MVTDRKGELNEDILNAGLLKTHAIGKVASSNG
jgi:hypothetical protein